MNLPTLEAQNKNDYVWLLGVPNQTTDPYHGGDYIDFSDGNLNATYVNLPLDMWYPNIMSDEQGQLSFYNNGCKIMDANHQLMENGQDINAGLMHQLYCDSPNHPIGYPSYQGQITLPYPGHPGEYIYFHLWTNDQYLTRQLWYSHIDMNANAGHGKVLLKNQFLLAEVFSPALTATRHANGRDWWVLAARDSSSVYYTFLLDPTGIHGPFVQQPDAGWIEGQYYALSNIFSPDGSKYVRVGGDAPGDFRMYDFDRCSGALSNPVTVHFPDTSTYAPWACFSPNSRFLYVQNWGERLYQYDTWASDINASIQLVGVYDGFLARYNLPTGFNSMTIGPDQRIYISCGNGTNLLHTIHKPNEPGLACDFRQHDVELPAQFPFYLPNFPNYRLYNLQGSACDTLGVQPPMVAFWRYLQDSLVGPGTLQFTDISYHEPVAWEWHFGDGASSTLQSPAHNYPAPGTYNVCLSACNAEGLCDTLCKDVVVATISSAVEIPVNNFPVKIYPNPAVNYLAIAYQGTQGQLLAKVTDVNGRTLLDQSFETSAGLATLDIRGLSPGVYFIVLLAEGKSWNGKFVKGE
jgi:hypothetical protein